MNTFIKSLSRQLRDLIASLRGRLFRRRSSRGTLLNALRHVHFRKLEARRVLSVNASLSPAGVLDIAIVDDGQSTVATLQQASAHEFFVDANGDHQHNDGSNGGAAELRGLLAELNQVNVVGDGSPGSAFFWRDNFSTASLNSVNENGNVVEIQGVANFESTATLNPVGDISISVQDNIRFAGQVTLDGNLHLESRSSIGAIDSSPESLISVSGHADLRANSIDLGNQANDQVVFGSLTFHSDGLVSISQAGSENQQMTIVGENTAQQVELDSTGELRIEGRIVSSGDIDLHASDTLSLAPNASLQSDHHSISLSALNQIEVAEGASIINRGGQVEIDSGDGTTYFSGRIDVSDLADGGQGGSVHLLGDRVALLADALIDASGDRQGGRVLIGGDYQGQNNAIQNASHTYVGSEVAIHADASRAGDAGRVIIWSNESTRFLGSITARGGSESGDGGFIEVSSLGWLNFAGHANTLAAAGQVGTLLLDPTNIFIANSQASATAAGMVGSDATADVGSGANPTIFAASGAVQDSLLTTSALQSALSTSRVLVTTASSDGTGVGDIQVVDAIVAPDGNNGLVLRADRDIVLRANIDFATNLNSGSLALVAQTGAIIASGGTLQLGGGLLTLSAATSVGSALSPVVTTGVTNFSAQGASGGVFISNTGSDIRITTTTVADLGLSVGGVTTIGDIVITNQGSIIVDSLVVATSNGIDNSITISAIGASSDLTIGSTGSVTAINDVDIALNADRTVQLAGFVISTTTGNIEISGNSGAGARNIVVQNTSISSLNGNILLDADQGTPQSGNFDGILITGSSATIASIGAGDVTLLGRGGDDSSIGQNGVVLLNSGPVSTATGQLSIQGFGGDSTVATRGILLSGSSTQVTSTSGAIDLLGVMSPSGSGLGHGIELQNSAAIFTNGSSPAATITLNGTGSGLGSGIIVDGTISSVNGDVNLIGQAGSIALRNHGIRVDGSVTSSGAAEINLTGNGGAVGVGLSASSILSLAASGSSGDIFVTGSAVGSAPLGIVAEGSITTINGSGVGTANVTLTADTMAIAPTATINVGAQRATVQELTAGTNIDLGSPLDSTTNTLELSAAELARFTAGVLQIGNLDAGDISVSQSITLTSVNTLHLITAGAVLDNNSAAADLSVTNLAIYSANGIASLSTLETVISVFAFHNTTAGNVSLSNTGGLTINAIDGILTSRNEAASGLVNLKAASPITFAVDTTSVSTITADATESPTPNVDNITVLSGVTVRSLTGDVIFQAGDSVLINAGAIVQADVGAVSLASGVNDVDNDGLQVIDGQVIAGTQVELNLGNVVNSSVTQGALGAIIAPALLLRNSPAGGGSFTLASTQNQVSTLAANTDGSVSFRNNQSLTIGTVNGVSGITTTNDPVKVDVTGTLTVGQPVVAGSSDVLLQATVDVNLNASLISSAGNLSIVAGGSANLNALVQTAGSGTIFISGDSITSTSGIDSGNGDILLTAVADITLSNVTSLTGNIGLNAGDDIDLQGNIGTSGDVVALAGGDFTMNAASMISATDIVITSGGAQRLGLLSATNVGLVATGDIIDANGDSVTNIRALNFSANARSVGQSDPGNGSPNTNANAIDLEVDTVAATATSGIYLQQLPIAGDLVVGQVNAISGSVSVNQLTFDLPILANLNSSTNVVSGLSDTGNGPVKVQVQSGSLQVDQPVSTVSGDILLQALSNVVTNSMVTSSSGNITVLAGADANLSSSIQTSGVGSILIDAVNINSSALITSGDGDILLTAANNLVQSGAISSTSGDVGLDANQVSLQANVMTGGNAVVNAGGNFVMTAVMLQANNVVVQAAGDIQLGSIIASNVGLNAGGDVLDNNGSLTNVQATTLRVTAGGTIGQPDVANGTPAVNANAIDLEVGTVAAQADAVYLQQVAGDLRVGQVASQVVSVDAIQANFNSTASPRASSGSTSALSGIAGVPGPVKVQVNVGNLTVDQSVSSVSGDILLAANGEVDLNAPVTSTSGNVHIQAGGNASLDALVQTGQLGSILVEATNINATSPVISQDGDILLRSRVNIVQSNTITSSSGDVGLVAANDITLSSSVTTAGDVLIVAGRDLTMTAASIVDAGDNVVVQTGRTQQLGLLDALNVGLVAGQDILDANGGAINVVATNLSVAAGGSIGQADALNGTPSVNSNALDLNVSTLAARAAAGIYLFEAISGADLQVGQVDAINVSVDPSVVNFNSTIAPNNASATTNAIAGLTDTGVGAVKVRVEGGSLTVDEAVSSISGDVLLSAAADVNVNAAVTSTSGNLHVSAAGDASLNALLQTASAGSIFVEAKDISGNAPVVSQNGDILLRARNDLTQTANISSSSGDIGLVAINDVLLQANVSTGGNVLVDAGRDFIMAAASVIDGGANSVIRTGSRQLLGLVDADNVGLDAGGDILDANGTATNVRASNLSASALGTIGQPDAANGIPTTNANAIDLNVNVVAARSSAGIYLQEVSGGGNLAIGQVNAISVSVDPTLVNFNSTTTPANASRTVAAVDGLTVTGTGAVKVQVENGDAGINRSVSSVSGDVLLQASGLLNTTAAITSATGNISLLAGANANLSTSILTGGPGSVLIEASNIASSATITTASGDVLLNASGDILQTANITSATGDVGLIAGNDILLQATVTAGGNVLVRAAGDFAMNSIAMIDANNIAYVETVGSQQLGLLDAIHVRLDAGGDILDANGGAANVRASTLGMISGGSIGQADVLNGIPNANANAIDLEVTTLAARASTGIYLQQLTAGGTTTVDTVNGVNVSVNSTRVNFNSTTTPVSFIDSTAALAGLNSVGNGPIKLKVDSSSLIVQQAVASNSGDVLLQASEDVVLQTTVTSTSGNISLLAGRDANINGAVQTGASGAVIVDATNINLNAAVTTAAGDMLFNATNNIVQAASLTSTTGNLALIAGQNVTSQASVTTDGNVLIQAGANFVMSGPALIDANSNLVIKTGGTIQLTIVDANNVGLEAGDSIIDNNGSATNILALNLSMNAGNAIGAADSLNGTPALNANAIDLEVGTVAARANSGVYLQEVVAGSNLVVGHVDAIAVVVNPLRVNFNSTTTVATQSSSTAALDGAIASGPIKIQVVAGTLTTTQSVNSSTGDVLLEALAANGDVIVNANIVSGSGHVTVHAGDDVNLNANITTGGAGTVLLLAENRTADAIGGVVMQPATSITTGGGNVRIVADNEGDIRLGLINAGAGSVSLIAEGSILDNNAGAMNIQANALRMVADAGVTNAANQVGIIGGTDLANGTPAANVNAIDTQVTTLAARSADGIYVLEADGVSISDTGPIAVQQANFNSTTTTLTDASLSDLTTTDNGPIKLQSLTGNIVVNDGSTNANVGVSANGSGDVLLEALAANADVTINANVVSGSGHITLHAGDDVNLNANITTGGAGTLFLLAENRTADAISGVVMQPATSITTGGGNVRIVADNEGDIRLGLINAGAGSVSLIAEGSILDNNAGAMNIQANALRMIADAGVSNAANQVGIIGGTDLANGVPAANVNAIDTQVTTLAARSADGIYVLEANGVTVDNTGSIAIQQANFNSTTTTLTDGSLSDLTTTDNGPIKLQSLTGNIVVNDGSTNLNVGVSANGSGDVLLEALAANGDVTINANVVSGSGHVTLHAGDDVNLNANITTGSVGTVFLLGENRTADAISGVVMQPATSITTSGGNVRIVADNEGDIRLGLINAGAGSVSLIAEGSILDNNAGAMNIQANALRMIADAGVSNAANQVGIIGGTDLANGVPAANVNAIDTQVTTLAARSADGIYVLEANGVTVDNTGSIAIQQANFNSTTTTLTDGSLSDLTTTDNGPIKLQSLTGNIVVNDGSTNANVGVSANGSGDVLLEALAANADVNVNAQVRSGTGNVSAHARQDVNLQAAIATSGVGEVYVLAERSLNSSSTITTASGDILLQANLDILVSGDITSSSGNIGLTTATRDILLLADISTTSGSVLINAGRDFTMDANSTIHAGQNILTNSVRTQQLGLLEATNVSVTAGGDILDSNSGAATNIRATNALLRAGGIVGGPDASNLPSGNDEAIDTEVDTIAAQSARGIYIREIGGNIRVGHVEVPVTEVRAGQVNFNSTRTDVAISLASSLDDLTTTVDGVIKVVAEAGSIRVTDGTDNDGVGVSAAANGDILLEARGVTSDVIVDSNAQIVSATGNLTLSADRDVNFNSRIQTGGAGTIFIEANRSIIGSGVVTSTNGDILLNATLDITLTGDVLSSSGDVGLVSGASGDIRLLSDIDTTGNVLVRSGGDFTMADTSRIGAGANLAADRSILIDTADTQILGLLEAGQVALRAGGDILDGNGGEVVVGGITTGVNIHATTLSMNAGGQIGQADLLNAPENNRNAIDLNVETIAANSRSAIYLREVAVGGALTVDRVAAVGVTIDVVNQVNFNSSTTRVSQAGNIGELSDLTTASGPIEVIVVAGTLTINDGNPGAVGGVNVGVLAGGGGDILLQTKDAGDIVINTGIETTGDVRLSSFGWIDENSTLARVVGDDLVVRAGLYAHLHDTTVNTLTATTLANGNLDAAWQILNKLASDRGDDFLELLQAFIDSLQTSGEVNRPALPADVAAILGFSQIPPGGLKAIPNLMDVLPTVLSKLLQDPNPSQNQMQPLMDYLRQDYRFIDQLAQQYSLYVVNQTDLSVRSVMTGDLSKSISQNPNVYIETRGSGADLTVTGTIQTSSTNSIEGAIVLVAGGKLTLADTIGQEGLLGTFSVQPNIDSNMNVGVRGQLINTIGNPTGDDGGYVLAKFYDGGDGVTESLKSTQFVIRLGPLSNDVETTDVFQRTHVYQRVAGQFGSAGESGFVSFIGYSDGKAQQFDVAGEVGIRTSLNNALSSISSFPRTDSNAAVFTRAVEFDSAFLDSNQELPTIAFIRRADDYFLFENVGEAEAAQNGSLINDLTVEGFAIQNVNTFGSQGATELPIDIPPPQFPVVINSIVDASPPRPTELNQVEIEFGTAQPKPFEVIVYRVAYEDSDEDGEADAGEVPGNEVIVSMEAIDLTGADEETSTTPKENQRVRIQVISSKTGGTPTPEDIERVKQELLKDPTRPSGVYAIIEKGTDGKEVVIDVFTVKDFEAQDTTSEPLIQLDATSKPKPEIDTDAVPAPEILPRPSTTDGTKLIKPVDDSERTGSVTESRFATTSLVAGSLWMIHQAKQKKSDIIESLSGLDGLKGSESIGFSRNARRKRKNKS